MLIKESGDSNPLKESKSPLIRAKGFVNFDMENNNEIRHYNEIQTIQYLGSKTRILDYICTPILKEPKINKVLDLFAGSASIGYALFSETTYLSSLIETADMRMYEMKKRHKANKHLP